MKEELSWVTPKQAGALVGCTSRTITNAIHAGKISATREDGRFSIEKSELYRVFPKAHQKEVAGNVSQAISENQRLGYENEMLKQFNSQKDKEIEFLREQINSMAHEKDKLIDAISTTTKLLEHQKNSQDDETKNRKSRGWRRFF